MDILADLMKEDLSGLKLQALKTQFPLEGVNFRLQENVVVIDVENDFASASLSPFGASVLGYQPLGEQAVLWQSSSAIFDGKKAIRGGIPICWPWFGKANADGLPAHGFVRSLDWQIVSIEALPAGTKLVFSIESDAQTQALWPYDFHLELSVLVGKTLSLSLTTRNLSDRPVDITQALHSYFNVSNVDQVSVTGLSGSECIDTLASPETRQPAEQPLELKAPIDSVFVNQHNTLQIVDDALNRKIQIEKNGASSIVWNPGSEIVKGFVDIADHAWCDFLCVEAGNVWDNSVSIASGEAQSLQMDIAVLPL